MSTRNMRVFISYSRENAAVTHLLSYILGEHGVQCEMDDQLVPGRRFDAGIQAMIRRADVVIVLLTNASASSIWVNQEIGFALALGKPIWPICTEREITPEGMLEGIEWFSLIDCRMSVEQSTVWSTLCGVRPKCRRQRTTIRTCDWIR